MLIDHTIMHACTTIIAIARYMLHVTYTHDLVVNLCSRLRR